MRAFSFLCELFVREGYCDSSPLVRFPLFCVNLQNLLAECIDRKVKLALHIINIDPYYTIRVDIIGGGRIIYTNRQDTISPKRGSNYEKNFERLTYFLSSY
jgi:hypothetical protein